MPQLAEAIQRMYGLVSGIPTLLVVDCVSLELLTSGGCPWVRKDAKAAAFPWRGQTSPPSDFGQDNMLFPMLAVSVRSCIFFVGIRFIMCTGRYCWSWRRSFLELVPAAKLLTSLAEPPFLRFSC
jgi:hypothetical protein